MATLAAWDHKFSVWLFEATRRHAWLHTMAVVFARWVFWLMLFALGMVIIVRRDPLHVRLLLFSIIVSLVFSTIVMLVVGYIFPRQRPFVTHHLHAMVPTIWLHQSFPSKHTALSFALAWPLFASDPLTGKWALVLAGLIGVSRIAVGVHYLSDVLAGALIGILVGAVFSYI